MNLSRYSHEQLVNLAKLSAEDIAEVNRRRQPPDANPIPQTTTGQSFPNCYAEVYG